MIKKKRNKRNLCEAIHKKAMIECRNHFWKISLQLSFRALAKQITDIYILIFYLNFYLNERGSGKHNMTSTFINGKLVYYHFFPYLSRWPSESAMIEVYQNHVFIMRERSEKMKMRYEKIRRFLYSCCLFLK